MDLNYNWFGLKQIQLEIDNSSLAKKKIHTKKDWFIHESWNQFLTRFSQLTLANDKWK